MAAVVRAPPISSGTFTAPPLPRPPLGLPKHVWEVMAGELGNEAPEIALLNVATALDRSRAFVQVFYSDKLWFALAQKFNISTLPRETAERAVIRHFQGQNERMKGMLRAAFSEECPAPSTDGAAKTTRLVLAERAFFEAFFQAHRGDAIAVRAGVEFGDVESIQSFFNMLDASDTWNSESQALFALLTGAERKDVAVQALLLNTPKFWTTIVNAGAFKKGITANALKAGYEAGWRTKRSDEAEQVLRSSITAASSSPATASEKKEGM